MGMARWARLATKVLSAIEPRSKKPYDSCVPYAHRIFILLEEPIIGGENGDPFCNCFKTRSKAQTSMIIIMNSAEKVNNQRVGDALAIKSILVGEGGRGAVVARRFRREGFGSVRQDKAHYCERSPAPTRYSLHLYVLLHTVSRRHQIRRAYRKISRFERQAHSSLVRLRF